MKGLPQSWVDILTKPTDDPKGRWADYNVNAHYYRELNRLVRCGLISQDEAIVYPDIDDYEDLITQRTSYNTGYSTLTAEGWDGLTEGQYDTMEIEFS